METTSERRYKFIPVTDVDIVYLGGVTDTITYTEKDRAEDTPEALSIWVHDAKTNTFVERLTCLKRNMLSYRFRKRLLKVENRTPLPVDQADAPTSD